MMSSSSKRSVSSPTVIYCTRCDLRLGIGERHLLRAGKAYHHHCYAKGQIIGSAESANQNPTNPGEQAVGYLAREPELTDISKP
jgi:hypothetical protein